jgi:hypothetical protein
MRRREFIGLAAGSVMTWPLSAHAQTSTMPVVGFLSSLSPLERTLVMPAFHQGLKKRVSSKVATSRSNIVGRKVGTSDCRNWPSVWSSGKLQ